MTRSANNEQSLAIQKKDGVILSAGAGSGKTFVIIEHLISKIIDIKNQSTSENLEIELPRKLSKIVLMTFTKKASGEMLVRLIDRIEELASSELDNQNFWKSVLKNLGQIQISTIHGFCSRLINSKIWPNLPVDLKVLSNFERKSKVQELCRQWIEQNKNQLTDLFLAHILDLYKAMDEVFSSPELRLSWEKGRNDNTVESEIENFFTEILELYNFNYIFNTNVQISISVEKLKKQGYLLIQSYQELVIKTGKINSKNYSEYYSLFEGFARFPSATKDMSFEELELRIELKQLNEILKDIKNDLDNLQTSYDVFIEWELKLYSLFDFVNSHYLSIPGISFSDLEYYVYKGLDSQDSIVKVGSLFNYFIVDEFQDTSYVQFEILKRCLNSNFNNLFCVGDKKQAIYGFRGGELQVFENCSKELGVNAQLSLKYNYRSSSEVISFNNMFFDKVLPVGKEYVGLDPHSVRMEYQDIPNTAPTGKVISYDVHETDEEVDLDIIESQAILEIIKIQMLNPEIKNIAILYKKLSPSHHLIDLLRDLNISFSAQVKIKFNEDPVICLYRHFLRYYINQHDLTAKERSKYLINNILLALELSSISSEVLNKFILNIAIMGINASFWKTLISLGISNALYSENSTLVDSIALECLGDPILIAKFLEKQDEKYSFEMISGENPKIYILTTHASKGLEYDSVIIGGIHKNGRYEGLKKKIGNLPKSFKWKMTFDQKNYFKSLNYHLEAEICSAKDFSESKRLLYVACTRAAKFLSYVNIDVNGKPKSKFGNSWINGFRIFPTDLVKSVELSIPGSLKEHAEVSYLLKDNLGIQNSAYNTKVGIISELSVTRLAALAECPYKFYIKNICKIEVDPYLINFSDEVEDEVEIKSSKARGSDLHFTIAKVLQKKITIESVPMKDRSIVSWVIDIINKESASEILSEKEIKFSFFGQMISAIPDLVLLNEGHFEVWDFKTGARKVESEDSYQFQLNAYAFAIGKVYGFTQDTVVCLKLIYLDQKDIVSNSLKLKDIGTFLFDIWSKTENLSQASSAHCKYCEYSKMCKFSSGIASI